MMSLWYLTELWIKISRADLGMKPMTARTTFICMRKPTSCSCLASSLLYQSLWPSSVVVSSNPVHLSFASLTVHRYLSSPWVSIFTLPHWCHLWTFHVCSSSFFLLSLWFGSSSTYFTIPTRGPAGRVRDGCWSWPRQFRLEVSFAANIHGLVSGLYTCSGSSSSPSEH